MSRTLRAVLVLGILLAAGLSWVALQAGNEPPPPDAAAHASQAPLPVNAAEATLPRQSAEPEPLAVRREAAPAPMAIGRTQTSAQLRGRCVAAEDGAPLADCVVDLWAWRKERGTTGADGCFAIDFVPMPSGSITVRTQRAGRVPLEGQLVSSGSVADLGTIALPRGFVVSGRVVDADGTAVPGHSVTVTGVDTTLPPGQVTMSTANARCGEDGSFTLGLPLPAGDWHAQLHGPRRLRGDGAFRVHPIAGAEPLVLVVEPPNEITGVVVSAGGQLLPDVGLRTEHGGAVAISSPMGAFELAPQHEVLASTRILLRDPERWPKAFVPPTVAWGERDVRVVIPMPGLIVEVVDDAGAPVDWFQLAFQPAAETHLASRFVSDPGGRTQVFPTSLGLYVLRVLPHGRPMLASEPRFLEVGSTPLAEQRVVLERLAKVTVQVVGADQAGVARAEVRLVRVAGRRAEASRLEYYPSLEALRQAQRGQRPTESVSWAMTDASGLCSLEAPASCNGFLLQVSKKGFAPRFLFDPPLSVGNPLRVELTAGGVLAGSLETYDQPTRLFRVRIDHAGPREFDGEDMSAIPLLSDATFRVPALAPGDYVVRVLRQMTPGVHAAKDTYVPTELARRVTVRARETTEVHLDVPPFRDGGLLGQLVGDTTARRVQLVFLDAANASREIRVAADGSFAAQALPPGRYHVAVHSPLLPAVLASVVEIAPGVAQPCEFAFTAKKLTLRLRTPEGEPTVGDFVLRCGPLQREVQLRSSELVLDPAPELAVEIRDKRAAAWSQPVVMPRDRSEHTAVVVVRRQR
ncbi:MAG TPA: carboxypeptidase-like regulatory domain-containing protein [Planctomycetota bacterium]